MCSMCPSVPRSPVPLVGPLTGRGSAVGESCITKARRGLPHITAQLIAHRHTQASGMTPLSTQCDGDMPNEYTNDDQLTKVQVRARQTQWAQPNTDSLCVAQDNGGGRAFRNVAQW